VADNREIGLIIAAKDRASAIIKKLGDNAKASFGGISVSSKSAGDSVAKLPDALGKASTSMLLFQNATSQMSGRLADAANKITAVAGLAATGGPLGIALASATGLLIAGSAAWDAYKADTKAAEDAQRSIEGVLIGTRLRLSEQKDAVRSLSDELRLFGLSARQQQIKLLEEQIESSNINIQALERETDAIVRKNAEDENSIVIQEDLSDREQRTIEANDRAIDVANKANDVRRQKLDLLKQLQTAEENEKLRLERKSKLTADVAKMEREAERKKREAERQREEVLRARAQREREVQQQILALREEQARKELEIRTKATNEQIALSEAAQQRTVELITSGVNITGAAFSALIDGTTDAKTAVKQFAQQSIQAVVQFATKSILANAAVAGSGAAASQAAIPVVGPLLATVASTAIYTLSKAFLNKFERGGVVRGGTPGQDSVLGLLKPNERVLTVEENRDIERFARSVLRTRPSQTGGGAVGPAAPGFASGGVVQSPTPVAAAGSVGGFTFAPSIGFANIPDATARKQFLLDMADDFEELINDRLIGRNLVRAG